MTTETGARRRRAEFSLRPLCMHCCGVHTPDKYRNVSRRPISCQGKDGFALLLSGGVKPTANGDTALIGLAKQHLLSLLFDRICSVPPSPSQLRYLLGAVCREWAAASTLTRAPDVSVGPELVTAALFPTNGHTRSLKFKKTLNQTL